MKKLFFLITLLLGTGVISQLYAVSADSSALQYERKTKRILIERTGLNTVRETYQVDVDSSNCITDAKMICGIHNRTYFEYKNTLLSSYIKDIVDGNPKVFRNDTSDFVRIKHSVSWPSVVDRTNLPYTLPFVYYEFIKIIPKGISENSILELLKMKEGQLFQSGNTPEPEAKLFGKIYQSVYPIFISRKGNVIVQTIGTKPLYDSDKYGWTIFTFVLVIILVTLICSKSEPLHDDDEGSHIFAMIIRLFTVVILLNNFLYASNSYKIYFEILLYIWILVNCFILMVANSKSDRWAVMRQNLMVSYEISFQYIYVSLWILYAVSTLLFVLGYSFQSNLIYSLISFGLCIIVFRDKYHEFFLKVQYTLKWYWFKKA